MPLMQKIFNIRLMMPLHFAQSMANTEIKDLEKKLVSNVLPRYSQQNSDIGIIQISGPLSNKPDFWSWLFGGTNYSDIRTEFRALLADNSVETIIFDIDSPGGEVAGLFDLVDEIYAARDKKNIISIVNEMAYSAAYAIASATSTIYIPRTGGTGSIGVITIHTDVSKWDEKLGVKYTVISAGDRKNDFSSHEPLSKEAYKIVKAEIDDINNLFIDTMSRNRGIEAKIIRNMEAGIFQGQKAIDAGLADEIKSLTDILGGGISMPKLSLKDAVSEVLKNATSEDTAKAMGELGYVTKAEHGTILEKLTKGYKEDSAEAVKNAVTNGVKEAKEATVGILELCSIAGLEKMGLKMIVDGISAADARDQIMAAKATTQTVNSTVNPLNSGEANPLLADANKRVKEAK